MSRFCSLVVLLSIVGVSRAAEQKVIAEGEWSKAVADSRGYALRGRLVLCEKRVSEERREISVYIELQEASEFIGGNMRVFCDLGKTDFRPEYKGGLNCELLDKDKGKVKTEPFAFSGATPRSQWVTMPTDSTVRLRTSPFGIHRKDALAIAPQLSQLWVIADNDPKEYFLTGTFTVEPTKEQIPAGNEHVWRGTIEFPPLKIVGKK